MAKKLTKNLLGIKQKKTATSADYHDELIERLKDHDYAVVYLNTALEESLKGDEESQRLLLKALKNVVEAQGNMGSLAKRARLKRESVKNIFSEEEKPYLQSFAALIHAMGFGIRFY